MLSLHKSYCNFQLILNFRYFTLEELNILVVCTNDIVNGILKKIRKKLFYTKQIVIPHNVQILFILIFKVE
jgi:hypothetical protein